jgi:Ca2+:H+ antiporter
MFKVLGFCFLVGGIRRHENIINPVFASTASSLLNTACAALVIPAAIFSQRKEGKKYASRIAALSRGAAIVLLAVFIVYLLFRHTTHAVDFEESTSVYREDQDELVESLAVGEPEETETTQQRVISILIRTLVLGGAGILVIFCAQFMFDAIESGHLEKRFTGMILLPLIAEGPERLQAINFAYYDRMAKALEFAIERSLHTALFVTPMTILFSWIMNTTLPMTLQFGVFETIALFLSVLLVAELIRDGKSTYLEGTVCLGTYVSHLFQKIREG